jgi:hypothetical protein
MSLRAFSYGGGVQSTAAMVLAARGEIDFPLFIFANVGNKAEHPASIAYVRDVAAPFAEKHGIELVTVHATYGGEPTDLYERVATGVGKSKSVHIPVFQSRTGAPSSRRCTWDYKIVPIQRELRRRGASKKNPAVVGLGISLDEIHRAKTSAGPRLAQVNEYPLLDLGLRRSDCMTVIADAGLPIPIKSSCWFCPYHSLNTWRRLKRESPELFEHAEQLERQMNESRGLQGEDVVWLTRTRLPLADAVGPEQMELDMEGGCESGYCLT